MNNNLRFPISDLAQELYDKMVIFAKYSNNSREQQEGEFTFIDEPNKYDVINEHYQKYIKKGNENTKIHFYSVFHHVTEKGHSIILTNTEFRNRRLSFSGQHLEMRKKGYEYFCYPFKQNVTFVFISPSGSIKFNPPSKNTSLWLSLTNIKYFPFNYFGITSDYDKLNLGSKLLFNNKKNEWCENHIKKLAHSHTTTDFILSNSNYFTKSTYGSCSNLQQFINKIKTIDEPLSYKQFKDLSFDDIYEIMSTAPIFKNPVNFIDNYVSFKKLKSKNSNYNTYFEDLIKIANETDNKINFSLNESNIKEQHDKMLLENLHKMKAKSINVHNKFLILEKYLPKEFKIIKTGKELLFEGLIQKHCVNTYSSNINQGSCCILTTEYDEKRYTAEIRFGTSWLSPNSEQTYRVNQFKGYANTPSPKALHEILENIINEVNEKELKIKNKKEVLDTSFDDNNNLRIEYIDYEF
jgi:hypothetical protein